MHDLVDVENGTLFQYNSIRASELLSLKGITSSPDGEEAVLEVLDHSV